MRANIFLNKEEIQLIFEALDHLYFETDRAIKFNHVNYLPKLKEHFIKKKKNTKNLLKRIKGCDI